MMNDYPLPPPWYLEDPVNALYHLDVEIRDTAINELIENIAAIESCIRGDFDIQSITNSIKSKFLSFIEIGCLAFKIKTWCIWKEDKSLKSFKDYCLKVLERPVWQINNYIKAAKVMIDLIAAGFEQLPQSLSQALELVNFKGNELLDKWENCIKNIPAQMTSAKRIKELLNPTPEEKKKRALNLPKKIADRLEKEARQQGLTVEELLENFLDDKTEETEDPDQGKLEAWEQDLEELVSEHEQKRTTGANLRLHDDSPKQQFKFDLPTEQPLFTALFINALLQSITRFQDLARE